MSTARKRASQPSFVIESIGPKLAAEYLRSNAENRKISKVTVRRYAGDMRRGEWVVNGEAIKFDEHGRLMDGQHRLLAIVESGATIDIAVFRDVARDTFKTLDSGKIRSPSDSLSALGRPNPNELGAALRLLVHYQSDSWTDHMRLRMTNTQIVAALELHPDLPDVSDRAMTKPLRARLITGSANVFGYYCCSRIDDDRAQEFFTRLADGRFTRKDQQPIYVLRERLIEVSAEAVSTPPRVKLAWLISAWNHYYARAELGRLSRTPGAMPRFDPEPFPHLSVSPRRANCV